MIMNSLTGYKLQFVSVSVESQSKSSSIVNYYSPCFNGRKKTATAGNLFQLYFKQLIMFLSCCFFKFHFQENVL